jgi:tRNA-2-methylthio-N6-dimethylallyladenosine synthase
MMASAWPNCWRQQGMRPRPEGEEADLVVLNTCHIRERAAEKVYSDIGRLRREDGSAPLIAVAGCVAQAEGEEIMARAPAVSMVVGPQAYHRLPDDFARRGAARPIPTCRPRPSSTPCRRAAGGPSAFLTVQEGCDKFCTYCVVPYTRGAEISRPFADLVEEAQGWSKPARARSRCWARTSTPGGKMSKGARSAGRADPRWPICPICPHPLYHQPPQRHDRRPDRRACRESTQADAIPAPAGAVGQRPGAQGDEPQPHGGSYLRMLEQIRAPRPDIALSGDFIVGFPGETDSRVRGNAAAGRYGRLCPVFSFKYSAPRPGTPAPTMDDQIAPEVMDERLQRLQAALQPQSAGLQPGHGRPACKFWSSASGKPGQWLGKSPWLQSVHFRAMPRSAIWSRWN